MNVLHLIVSIIIGVIVYFVCVFVGLVFPLPQLLGVLAGIVWYLGGPRNYNLS